MAPRIHTIGLDIAKDVFQVHGVDKDGKIVARRKLLRSEVASYFEKLKPCLVGIEACATAHHWARTLAGFGHRVRLVHPPFVTPYVKSQKNDQADAEAICEAVARPNMRFVPVKSKSQQAILTVHRTRTMLLRQRTMLINLFRGQIAEYGYVAELGRAGIEALLTFIETDRAKFIPPLALKALKVVATRIRELEAEAGALEAKIRAWHRASAQSQRLETIPGISHLSASAIAATAPNPAAFKSGRAFAAWLGLVPRQYSSGGKTQLGHITKRGNPYIRRLLVSGARTVLVHYERSDAHIARFRKLLKTKPFLVVAVALANRMARVAWAVMMRRKPYKAELSPVPNN